jgi:hypothetical protein
MPAVAAPVADESEGLLAYLAQQRLALRLTAYGLIDDQARATPTASPLSVGGLIKHVAAAERGWMATVLGRDRERSLEKHADSFRVEPGETLAGTLELYEQATGETDAIIAGIPDLGQAVPVPPGCPLRRVSRRGRCGGCCSTSSPRRPATPATPTSSANSWTARTRPRC